MESPGEVFRNLTPSVLFIENLRETLRAVSVIGITPDDYFDKIRDIFDQNLGKNLAIPMYEELQNVIPNITEEKRFSYIKCLMEEFDEVFNPHFDCFKGFVLSSIFKVPKCVSLEENKEIDEILKNYSKNDSEEVTRLIEQSMKNIKQQQAYYRCLKEEVVKQEEFIKALD